VCGCPGDDRHGAEEAAEPRLLPDMGRLSRNREFTACPCGGKPSREWRRLRGKQPGGPHHRAEFLPFLRSLMTRSAKARS
jgi:hypothetical protein